MTMVLTKADVKKERWLHILQTLDSLDYLTTSQLQHLHDLSGRRNALRVLGDLEAAGLVRSFFLKEKVFYLTAKGKAEIGGDMTKLRKKTQNVDHFLLRNQVFIHHKGSTHWRGEVPITFSRDQTIIPDGYFAYNEQHYFIEIDRTQSMKKNEEKMEMYRAFRDSGWFQKNFGHFPTLFIVTVSAYRQQKWRGLVDGFRAKVLLHTDLS